MKKLLSVLLVFLSFAVIDVSAEVLKLYGYDGSKYSVYLGKFGYSAGRFTTEVSDYDSESVFNDYGNYGSKYGTNSINNPYSKFGGKYDTNSVSNPYSNNPPAIVDGKGNIVGYLTANKYASNTTLGKNISKAFGLQ